MHIFDKKFGQNSFFKKVFAILSDKFYVALHKNDKKNVLKQIQEKYFKNLHSNKAYFVYSSSHF